MIQLVHQALHFPGIDQSTPGAPHEFDLNVPHASRAVHQQHDLKQRGRNGPAFLDQTQMIPDNDQLFPLVLHGDIFQVSPYRGIFLTHFHLPDIPDRASSRNPHAPRGEN